LIFLDAIHFSRGYKRFSPFHGDFSDTLARRLDAGIAKILLEIGSDGTVQMEEHRLKVVVFGTHGAGKSTFIQSLDPHARHIEALEDDSPTTVSMDFGRVSLCGHVVYLFGTPGQERFFFVRNILSRGMDGAIVVVDSTAGVDENTYNLCVWLKGSGIPFAVMANKCDCRGADPDQVAAGLDGARVYAISAQEGTNVLPALESFVRELVPADARIP
jgi:hypothetical protein